MAGRPPELLLINCTLSAVARKESSVQRVVHAYRQWRSDPARDDPTSGLVGRTGTGREVAQLPAGAGHPMATFLQASPLQAAPLPDADNSLRTTGKSVFQRSVGRPPKDDVRILGRVVWKRSTP